MDQKSFYLLSHRKKMQKTEFLKSPSIYHIIIVSSILYVIWIWSPLGLFHSWNEAYYLLRVSYILKGGSYLDWNFDNPPLFVYFLLLLSKIFGISLIAFRMLIVICSLINVYLVYLIGKEINGEALASASLFGFFPMIVIFSKIIQIDLFALMLMTISFYFALLGIKNRKWLFLSGIFLGLAIFAKIPMGIVILPIFFLMLQKKVEIKYFLFLLAEAVLIPLPWITYAFLTKPSFFAPTTSSRNFFGLGKMHSLAPLYQFSMIILAWSIFISLLLLFKKKKPISAEEKSLALFSLSFSLFFIFLPNHEYYLLPLLIPLFLYIGKAYKKYCKKLAIIFLSISTILLLIKPIYDVNWEEACNYINKHYPRNITIYSTNLRVVEYYTHKKVNYLEENISTNNSIVLFTYADKANLEYLHILQFIQKNFILEKNFHDKIYIYISKDLVK